MRRIIVLLMLLTGLATVIGAIVESLPRHYGTPVFHIAVAIVFVTLILVHITLNHRAIIKYIRGKK